MTNNGETTMTQTITLKATRFEDHDDSLQAAVAHVAADLGVEEWQCEARFDDERNRETIVVTVRA